MFLGEKFTIKTPFKEDELKERLFGLIESSGGPLKFYYGSKPYVGRIKGNHFKICRLKPTSQMSGDAIMSMLSIFINRRVEGGSDVGALPMISGRIKDNFIEMIIRPKILDIIAPIAIPLIFILLLFPYLLNNRDRNAVLIIFFMCVFFIALVLLYIKSYKLNLSNEKTFLNNTFTV